jgi:LmbE family N-acetylglucosaminyl deacetylase
MQILFVGCHPDDLEIGCGGTIARFAREGHTVFICHVANGNMGHTEIMPEELRRIRLSEAQEAGKLLGAVVVDTLDIGDLKVRADNLETIQKMVDIIRRTQPDVIITHSPDDYMTDHIEVSKLVFDASFSASIPHYTTRVAGVAKITPLYYMDTVAGINFQPTEYVDISEVIETKLAALACHQSQIRWLKDHDGIDFLDFVRTVSKFRGLQSGVAYAEGFQQCPTWPRMVTKRLLP